MPPVPAPASSQGGYSLQSTHCRTTSSVIAIRYIHPYYTGHVGNCQEKFPAVWFVQNPQILGKPASLTAAQRLRWKDIRKVGVLPDAVTR